MPLQRLGPATKVWPPRPRAEQIETLRIKENAITQRDAMEENWPTEREIRNHAYEIYIARRDEPGSALNDWLAAEVQLKAAGERAMARGKS